MLPIGLLTGGYGENELIGAGAYRVFRNPKDLHNHFAELGLSTVYRTLVALTDAGLLDAIGQHDGEATYRLCGGAHHHHLVCSDCRRVEELSECDLSPIEQGIATDTGFRVDGHTLTFHGVCRECQKR